MILYYIIIILYYYNIPIIIGILTLFHIIKISVGSENGAFYLIFEESVKLDVWRDT